MPMSMFSAISWREQVNFNEEMMMMSTLYYNNKLSWILIVLAHSINRPRVDMSFQ